MSLKEKETAEVDLSCRSRKSRFRNQIKALVTSGMSEEDARELIARGVWCPRVRTALTRAQKEKDRWRESAEIDLLSGLGTRRSYNVFLEKKLDLFRRGQKQSLHIAKIDIDLFSWLNDVLQASLFGDLGIQEIGNLVRETTRENDKGFRTGGEEFVIIFGEFKDSETAFSTGQRLVETVRQKLLANMIKVVVQGKRRVQIKENVWEREGTLISKQLAQGILALESNLRKEKNPLEAIKGKEQEKSDLLRSIREVIENESRMAIYQSYVEDERTISQLSKDSLQERQSIEDSLGDDLKTIFGRITCSIGLLSLLPKDRGSPLDTEGIETTLDRLYNKAKQEGRDRLELQLGLEGTFATPANYES